MSFDWRDYLKVAKELSIQAEDSLIASAKIRSAISRAYYAAHWIARDHLVKIEGVRINKNGRAHGEVIEEFIKSPDETRRKIGTHLRRLKVYRTKADYKSGAKCSKGIMSVSISYSEGIIKKVQGLTQNEHPLLEAKRQELQDIAQRISSIAKTRQRLALPDAVMRLHSSGFEGT